MKNLLLVLVSLLSTVCYVQQSYRPANKSKPVLSKTSSKVANSNVNIRPSLKSANDSASYAIGLKVADTYSRQGIKSINSALLVKGRIPGGSTLIFDVELIGVKKKYG